MCGPPQVRLITKRSARTSTGSSASTDEIRKCPHSYFGLSTVNSQHLQHSADCCSTVLLDERLGLSAWRPLIIVAAYLPQTVNTLHRTSGPSEPPRSHRLLMIGSSGNLQTSPVRCPNSARSMSTKCQHTSLEVVSKNSSIRICYIMPGIVAWYIWWYIMCHFISSGEHV